MIGYLVKYSTGSYDDYYQHCVAVYLNKEQAEQKCKELDNEHLRPNWREIPDENWEEIMDEYDEILDMDESEFDYSDDYPYLYLKGNYKDPNFEEKRQQRQKSENKLLEDLVIQRYPNWAREQARKQIDLREAAEQNQYEDYGECFIEEVQIYE